MKEILETRHEIYQALGESGDQEDAFPPVWHEGEDEEEGEELDYEPVQDDLGFACRPLSK